MAPPPPGYLLPQDLVDALSQPTYMALFDDGNTNQRSQVDGSTGVQSVLRRALSWVSSWLPDIYTKLPPEAPAGLTVGGDNIPVLLKDASLQYACILAYRRHPEYVKTYGAEPGGRLMGELIEMMARIQASTQRVTPNDTPPAQAPNNVGGFTQADGPRIAMSNPDLTSNTGDF